MALPVTLLLLVPWSNFLEHIDFLPACNYQSLPFLSPYVLWSILLSPCAFLQLNPVMPPTATLPQVTAFQHSTYFISQQCQHLAWSFGFEFSLLIHTYLPNYNPIKARHLTAVITAAKSFGALIYRLNNNILLYSDCDTTHNVFSSMASAIYFPATKLAKYLGRAKH